MSIFYCTGCDKLCDSDDGAEEDATGLGCICIDCAGEREEGAQSHEAKDER